RPPWSKSACHALRPARGIAALWMWSSVFGFDATTADGTTAYSAAPPSRSKGVSANTSSSTARPFAPGPRAATVPEISYDGIAGSRPSGHVSSSRVIAAAWTRITAPPGPGAGSPIFAIPGRAGGGRRAAGAGGQIVVLCGLERVRRGQSSSQHAVPSFVSGKTGGYDGLVPSVTVAVFVFPWANIGLRGGPLVWRGGIKPHKEHIVVNAAERRGQP